MAVDVYVANRSGLLLVDPYNDLLSDGGKLWPHVKPVAESVGTLTNLRALVDAARRAGVVVLYVPHRQWRETSYDGWRHPGPWQALLDRETVFAEATWGCDWHPDLVPQPGEVVLEQHWGQDGFANTDLDFQLKQFGVKRIIVAGLVANTCVEATARRGADLGYHVTLVRDATAGTWLGTGALGVFTVLTNFLAHPFQRLSGTAAIMQLNTRLEHAAIAAGFVLVTMVGRETGADSRLAVNGLAASVSKGPICGYVRRDRDGDRRHGQLALLDVSRGIDASATGPSRRVPCDL